MHTTRTEGILQMYNDVLFLDSRYYVIIFIPCIIEFLIPNMILINSSAANNV